MTKHSPLGEDPTDTAIAAGTIDSEEAVATRSHFCKVADAAAKP